MNRIKGTRQVEVNGKLLWVTSKNTEGNIRICNLCKEAKELEAYPYLKQQSGEYYLKARCKKCISRSSRSWNLANLDKHQESKFKYNLSFYGITPEQYREKLKQQNGVCEICKSPPSQGRTLLSVDHDHKCCPKGGSCGRCVRGLLCEDCNKAIGILKESKDTLRSAISYLDKYDEHFEG